MTILVQMQPENFDEFEATASASHAADSVASGRWLAHEAEQLARSEFRRLLPNQVATPDHYLYEIRLDTAGPVLGYLWFGAVTRGSIKVAFVFQLIVYPQYRRQGHGRAALARVEELAAGLGLAVVALNVFGSNAGAQALYRSLGYGVTSLSMQKELSSSGRLQLPMSAADVKP